MKWKVEGYDTFEGGDAFYPISEHDTEDEALAAAKKRLDELEQSQPSQSSGGQSGIQDRVYVSGPGCPRRRF